MTPWWKRPEPLDREIVEQVEPVEIPVINEVKRRLAKGDVLGAIRHGFPVAADDLSRAYNIPLLPGHTYEEFLRRIRGHKELGHLPEHYRRFYQLYAPIRYGPPGTSAPDGSPTALIDLLKAIYAERPMWQLYIAPRDSPREDEEEGPTGTTEPSDGQGAMAP